MDLLKSLDLFSGIGGLSIALRDYVRPVAYCEIDPFCQSVLLSRMQEGDLPKAPIWDDIRTLDAKRNILATDLAIDILVGGFPCQDISVAGAGKGLEGERSGLFYEIVRLCGELKPRFIFLENVPAITTRGGTEVVREIAKMGYDCRWLVISAASVGAMHRRERFFLLAHSNNNGASTGKGGGSVGERFASGEGSQEPKEGFGTAERTGSISTDVANTGSERLEGFGRRTKRKEPEQSKPTLSSEDDSDTSCESIKQTNSSSMPIGTSSKTWRNNSSKYWPYESRDDWQKALDDVDKCIDAVQARLVHNTEALKALGNAVVPVQARTAFEILIGLK